LTTLALAALLITANTSFAGDLYQLQFCWYGDIPTYPAHIEFNVYEGDKIDSDKLKGSSSMDFEWFGTYGENWNFMYDDVAFLTSAWVEDGMLRVCATADGWDNGKFKSTSSFEIIVNGESSGLLDLHTSCSQEIPIDTPLAGDPGGTWYIVGGAGDCVPGGPDCPEGDKLYELHGEFHIPLCGCVPTDMTFTVFKKEDEWKGASTATWTGTGLDNIVCDNVACLTGAYLDGETLVVEFESFGYKDNGEFDSETSFELDLGDCGVYKLVKYHTSCSKIIYLNTPFDLGCNAFIMFTGGCGACIVDQPIPAGDSSWSEVKSLY
jgi:hypothetical protein